MDRGCAGAIYTGAEGDNGIVHDKNWLRFPYVFIIWRCHDLPRTRICTCRYALQRFIEIAQARKPGMPIKFNGMLFGAARPPHQDENAWGGLNWWQNMRLPYYNMLPAGDFDELKTMLSAFARS
jgi:hypothetical protein